MASTTTAHRAAAPRPTSPAVDDVAIAVAAFVGSLVLTLALVPRNTVGGVTLAGLEGLDALGLVLVVMSTAPVVAWRRAPLAVFALTASASALLVGLGSSIGLPLGATAALYLLATGRSEERPWTRATTAAVVVLFVVYLGATASAEGAFPGVDLSHSGLAWAVAWFAGERTRLRRQEIAELHERAARAEREAERERLLAVAEERARIARDLHDSAGHAINVIAVRAGAARLRHHQKPGRSLGALQAIEELARQTVEELDRFVGALRDDEALYGAVEALAALASLDTLLAQHTASGLDVTLDTAGVPRQLTGGIDQAVFRILQEALTNAARHGSGSARVELGFGDDALEVTVTNPLDAATGGRSAGGHGLVGMRERATLLGGDLAAERSGAAFRVHAFLPYGGRRP